MVRRAFTIAATASLVFAAGCGGGSHHPAAPGFPDPEPSQNTTPRIQGITGAPQSSNGRLPDSRLAPVYGGRLRRDGAAAGWNTMALAAHHYLHRASIYPNGQDASYRTYGRQVYWKQWWCDRGACQNAATPGYSNHGWGHAVDLGNCGQRWITSTIGGRFGWRWGEVTYECWHVTYYGGFHRPDPGPSLLYPVLRQGSGGYGQSFEVHYVQALLHTHHVGVAWTHGQFTKGTRHAVQRFQRSRHIHADGVVGRATWRALRR